MIDPDRQLLEDLTFLHGQDQAEQIMVRLEQRISLFQATNPGLSKPLNQVRFDEQDAILITYGDMVSQDSEAPLATLSQFLKLWVAGYLNSIHILPFYPYSSDDGFSVLDYRAVDPQLGNWDQVRTIGQNFRLMFDAVINHISSGSAWFQGYLNNDSRYRDYFITVEPDLDLSQVFRPRTLPVLTPVEQLSAEGEVVQKLVWTTFSADQIDLNFAHPEVLFEILDLLLFYIAQGAEFIRLDAIAYLWKEIGTNCIHLDQTHRIIQIMRRVLDRVAPRVSLITETNVPHLDNIAYFGDGTNEAQMVYNFSLPPLTLHAFHTGNAEKLTRWAQTLELPSDQVTFFNFLASHDGIGVTPALGILSAAEIDQLGQRITDLGGYVSEKTNADGSKSLYELNINFLDALGNPAVGIESIELVAQRFLASQAILLALRGVPGIYFHSLFGSRGWPAGVKHTGRARTINREKLSLDQLESELMDSGSLRNRVFAGYRRLLAQRRSTSAFHPNGAQQILSLHQAIFSVLRTSPDGSDQILCLINVANLSIKLSLHREEFGLLASGELRDLVTGQLLRSQNRALTLEIEPYQVLWLQFL